jgi:hypothetical protein
VNRRVALGVGALAVAVLLVAVGVLLGRSGGHDDSPAAPAPAPSRPAATSTAVPSPAVSWVDDYSFYEIPGGQRVPRSASAGPSHLTDRGALASGFAHSPQGAVMAAVNIVARTNWALGRPIWEPTITRQVVGAWQPALLANARRLGRVDVPPPGQRVPDTEDHVAGFDVLSYTSDTARIRWLISGVDESGSVLYSAVPGEVDWADGDWRLVAPQDGSWANTGELVSGTGGFVLFPGY